MCNSILFVSARGRGEDETQFNARPFQSSGYSLLEKKRKIIGKEVLRKNLEMKAEGKEERAEIK